MKRQDYLTWDEYFMEMAELTAKRSTCMRRSVGAVIVKDRHAIATGYNGAPRGLHDDKMHWNREGSFVDTKYAYVCHAELNAILNYRGDLSGSKIYVKLFPCNECAKAIIQSGIKEVIYKCDKYKDTDSVKVSKKMFDMAGVKYTEYQSRGIKLEMDL